MTDEEYRKNEDGMLEITSPKVNAVSLSTLETNKVFKQTQIEEHNAKSAEHLALLQSELEEIEALIAKAVELGVEP